MPVRYTSNHGSTVREFCENRDILARAVAVELIETRIGLSVWF